MSKSENELVLDVSQAVKFKLACQLNGLTNYHIEKMCEGNILSPIKTFIRGGYSIVETIGQHIVDCSLNPIISESDRRISREIEVESHDTRLGQLKLDMSKINLFLTTEQSKDYVPCEKVLLQLKELKGKSILNANVLDYLLKPEHQYLIPEEWESGPYYFPFWGTIYRFPESGLAVRCMSFTYSGGHRWYSTFIFFNTPPFLYTSLQS